MAVSEEQVEIVKPRTDKREYSRIVLRNSLEVLLISDPDTDKAAVAMNVRVGSFNDPEGLQGLAQLLMHTLFYASEKYPLEDDFSKFIAEHGGSERGSLNFRNTYYVFDVNIDCFKEALDRFAQPFIKALMSDDAVMREKKVVDSGYQDTLVSDVRRMHQVHQDDFMLNVKLQLFALIAKQAAFHQLRSVDQLGFATGFKRRNHFGIHGVQFTIQSAIKGPGYIDLRVEEFLKNFESKLYEMTNDEFKNNINALIAMKLEKHKNLMEESKFYWKEISDGTLKFDRRESEVAALRQLTQQEFIDFFIEYIKVGAPQKKILSIRVYGRLHSSEYTVDKSKAGQPHTVIIDDIFSFRRSRPLYVSFKGGFGHMEL